MYHVYVLKSMINNRYYVGSTSNIEERVQRHNAGRVRSTKPFIPWELIYSEPFTSLKTANRREFQIKAWKSREAIERLIEVSLV